jgi:murein L,D-transpeptidase YcbB/YkuD
MPSEVSRSSRNISQAGSLKERITRGRIRGMTIAFASYVILSLRWAIALAVICSAPVFFAKERGRDDAVEADVRAFYERTGHRPVWVDVHGQPTDLAWRALGRLRVAGDDALADEDYEHADLEYEASALAVSSSSVDAAAFDVRLTRNVLEYFRDLHLGRVDPRALGFHLDHPAEPHDFPAWLQSAVSRRSFDAVVAALRPPFVQYRRLKQMLPTYREGDAARGRQIELAMERLRWLPDLAGEQLIVVNIPMFHLWGWEPERSDGLSVIDMAAITGRAGATKTPVFTSRITSVVLNPEWVVPDSIARNEILPKLNRDPTYLARNHMEMTGEGSRVRIRQLPGPWNALGQIKFVIPNVHDVYLHGTPAPELFEKARRDFSHGCVRLEDPLRLAEWVLSAEQGWTRQRMLEVIAQGTTRGVTVSRPPRVVLFYMTAAFIPDRGEIRFVDDIYGHDARLDAWLKARANGDDQ